MARTTDERTSKVKSIPRLEIRVTDLLAGILLWLKFTHQIDWSWWWVTAPVWVPLVLTIVFVAMRGDPK